MKTLAIALLAALVLAGCGGAELPDNPPRSLDITIGPDGSRMEKDLLGLGPRLVMSTAESKDRGPQSIRLTNSSAATVRIVDARIDRAAFRLTDSPEFPAVMAPGDNITISVEFAPLKVGRDEGVLTVDFDGRESLRVQLSGLNAKGIEGNLEPDLQTIFDALGYEVDVAMPAEPPTDIDVSKWDNGNSISKSREPLGDEVIAPYFERADATKPTGLIPLGNYIGRTTADLGWFGVHARDDMQRSQNVLAFKGGEDEFGGQNQQLLPGIGKGNYEDLVAGSVVEFNPAFEPFAVWDGSRDLSTDDRLNNSQDRGMRVYTAKIAGGVVPNAYLVANDSSTPTFKNYDYQDVIFLLTNVRIAD